MIRPTQRINEAEGEASATKESLSSSALRRCSKCAERMTDSAAESLGMTMPRTGSSRSGEMDLGDEQEDREPEEQEVEKSEAPPSSTSTNGGACFPKEAQEPKKQERLPE